MYHVAASETGLLVPTLPVQSVLMNDASDRLLWLRRRADLPSKADAARAYGIPYEIYKKLEDGTRGLTPEHTDRIANYHGVSRGWLMFNEGAPEGENSVPLAGFIGAGQEITLFDDNENIGRTDALIAGPDAIALEVRGDSMFPLARNSDLIFVGPPRRDLDRLLGYECAVRLHDGRQLFKILERGSKQGLFDLRSYNAEPMRDQQVHSAGAFIGVRRR